MKHLIETIIDDLKGNPLGIIMLIVFGMVVYNSFSGDAPFAGDAADYEYEKDFEYAEAAKEQMIEDHLRDLEAKEAEAAEYATLYYINNGYYFHNDINCKGLDGYRNNLNTTSPGDLIEHPELSPCNWCVKGND